MAVTYYHDNYKHQNYQKWKYARLPYLTYIHVPEKLEAGN